MSTLAELLGTYAPGHLLEHDGVEYVFGRIDQRTKAALAVAYFRRARESVYLLKGEVSEQEFDRQLQHVTAEYRKGRYGFPLGESYSYFMGEGLAEMVQALTGRALGQCEDLVEARPIETFHVLLCVVTESSPALKKTMLSQPDSEPVRRLLDLLTPTSNGTPPGSGTVPPGSPRRASAPTASPG